MPCVKARLYKAQIMPMNKFMFNTLKARLMQTNVTQLLLQTLLKWQRDECINMGATLAYYALFSLFPLMLVVLSIFGYVVGPRSDIYRDILAFAQDALPPQAYGIVAQTLLQLNQRSTGASIIGFLLLVLVASGYFSVLDYSFDKIWTSQTLPPTNGQWKAIAIAFIRRRAQSFVLILGIVLLLLLSQITHVTLLIILRILGGISNQIDGVKMDFAFTFGTLQLLSSFLFLLVVVMILFKILPPVPLRWRQVWGGALLTSSLLFTLQQLAGNSMITIGSRFQTYGGGGGWFSSCGFTSPIKFCYWGVSLPMSILNYLAKTLVSHDI